MTVAAALGATGLLVLVVAFIWWLVSWGRKDEEQLRAGDARIDELGRAVEDRDRTIATLQDEAKRDKAALAAAEKQRATAIQLVEKVAKDSPSAVSAAIRSQLERLQALSRVPQVPAGAAGEGGGGEGAVHDGTDVPG